jgi:hypothetical protein
MIVAVMRKGVMEGPREGGEQDSAQVQRPFPFPLCWVSVAALSSREPGDGQVSCWFRQGEVGVMPG